MKHLKRIMLKRGVEGIAILLVFTLLIGALCTPFVAFNEWLEHPVSITTDILFGGDGDYSLTDQVNAKVVKYRGEIEKWVSVNRNGYCDVSQYTNVLLAIMMSESGGSSNDPMQSSECGKNTKFPRAPNGITNPSYSIECGVKDFADGMKRAINSGLKGNDALYATIDGYNKGLGIIKEHSKKGKYSFEVSCQYCHTHRFNDNKKSYSTAAELKKLFKLEKNNYWDGGNWRWNYGNMFYVYRVLSYLNFCETIQDDGTIGTKIVKEAYSKLGCRYWWGKSGPDNFDCSGFVYWCHKQSGVNLSRSSANAYSSAGKSVSYNNLKPGDVITFDWNNDKSAEHVGIYIGNDYMIHANGNSSIKGNSSKYVVKKQSLTSYYKNHILRCRRLY